ncbi:MAG: peptide-methionine (R)-S-oxide reductase MsrB [Gemmatimonadaceae bacterium]|nr:peptide-methionine (R)-S-oxide reductase MsrB [Gemmatimonadaceae bacterium]
MDHHDADDGRARGHSAATDSAAAGATPPNGARIEKSEREWESCLTPEQFHVMREKGTERAFTGKYWNTKEKGTYHCAACGEPLFASETKYDSGTGWPSFWSPVSPEAVATETDETHGMRRTEALCARCGAHLGHIFDDGPRPTGTRYCMNSVSLDLRKEQKTRGGEDEKTG